ncbi:MAG TPA: helix-turn-helix transcriptional regulator [Gammaproteobacteria bacterium]|nr:helix-turn-helix transcriptional regulator [Gammaproteobacteria bacterium]
MDVKTLCLGVLTLGDKTGYEIKKHFERAFSHFFVPGFGSIYPALGALTREGFVTHTDVAQSKRPDKKVYSITAEGRALLMQALLSTPPRHKVRSEFAVLLYFAHLLPRNRLAALLDERVRDIETMLGNIDCFERDDLPSPSREMVAGLGRATLQAQLDYIRAHRDWLLREIDRYQKRIPRSLGHASSG